MRSSDGPRQQNTPTGACSREEAVKPRGTAKGPSPSPAQDGLTSRECEGIGLMEQVVARDNMWAALKRLNKEIKRRTDVVGIFPNRDRSDWWALCSPSKTMNGSVGRRYFSQESMARLNRTDPEPQQLETSLVRAS